MKAHFDVIPMTLRNLTQMHHMWIKSNCKKKLSTTMKCFQSFPRVNESFAERIWASKLANRIDSLTYLDEVNVDIGISVRECVGMHVCNKFCFKQLTAAIYYRRVHNFNARKHIPIYLHFIPDSCRLMSVSSEVRSIIKDKTRQRVCELFQQNGNFTFFLQNPMPYNCAKTKWSIKFIAAFKV